MRKGSMKLRKKEITNLINEARLKEPNAFTRLMKFYMKDMYRVAISILRNDEDAADAIQDTILICWEKIHTLKETKFFKTWMTRILINQCFDLRNKYKNETAYEESKEAVSYDECNIELKEALSLLDEKYRIPIMLFYGQGYRIREIAELLHMPVSTVQTRLARGREQLARYYGIERV